MWQITTPYTLHPCNALGIQMNEELSLLTQAVHNLHKRVSTGKRNRYDIGNNVYIWYSNGVLTNLFWRNKCFDCLSGKLIDKPLGNIGFYVSLSASFEKEYIRVAEVDLLGCEFSDYMVAVLEDIVCKF